MKRYRVTVKEIWYQEFGIDAESENDAIEGVKNGEGDAIGDPEYSHTSEDEDSHTLSDYQEE